MAINLADGSRPVFEIMNPVIQIQDQAKVSVVNANTVHLPSPFRNLLVTRPVSNNYHNGKHDQLNFIYFQD
jgi:hypothetical protein